MPNQDIVPAIPCRSVNTVIKGSVCLNSMRLPTLEADILVSIS